MVSASIRQEREKQKKKGETIAASQGRKSKSSILVSAVPKPMESSEFKELAAKNVIRKEWSRSIGSGTFGTYRGISVIIKQYKDKRYARNNSHNLSLLQKEGKHEARVLLNLGDHPGIPLLFGVSLKEVPVSLMLKFHGNGDESLAVNKAAKNKIVSVKRDWNRIFYDTTDALEHIHKCGFAHNDLKTNLFVLEKCDDQVLHPVIIDFGKSVAFSKANNPVS